MSASPYATMLDTAQARIAALEAEKKALLAKLRELLDAATAGLDMMLVSAQRRSLVIVIRRVSEALNTQ